MAGVVEETVEGQTLVTVERQLLLVVRAGMAGDRSAIQREVAALARKLEPGNAEYARALRRAAGLAPVVLPPPAPIDGACEPR